MRQRYAVIGDAMVDVTSRGPVPTEFGADMPAVNTIQPGGAGANIAVWLASLGQSVSLYARVGADLAGNQVAEAILEHGVECAFQRSTDTPTGTCVVLVANNGERFMRSDPGANVELTLPNVADLQSRHVHVSAYALRSPKVAQALPAFTAEARRQSMTTSVDLAAVYMANDHAAVLHNCAWDIAFGTRDEFTALEDHLAPIRVVKAGAHGVEVRHMDERHVQPAPNIAPLDTTGAGDAYAAGFLTDWVHDHDIRGAMTRARQVAALALGRVGAWPSITLPAK